MRQVYIESPYAGDVIANEAYARRCMLDCLERGEAPYASHLLYSQVLDDNDPQQRALALKAADAWRDYADTVVVYTDRGISHGMAEGLKRAYDLSLEVEYRRLPGYRAEDFEIGVPADSDEAELLIAAADFVGELMRAAAGPFASPLLIIH